MVVWRRQNVPKIFFLIICGLLVVIFSCVKEPVSTEVPQNETVKISNSTTVAEVPESDNVSEVAPEPAGIEALAPPLTLEERFSYTYGYLLMETAMRDVQGINPNYFARGAFDSGLGASPLIDKSSMNTVLYEYQDKLITEAAKRLEELARKNLEDAESFLAVNGQREGVITTPSGLQYEILNIPEGESPKESDTVRVNYRLTYLDGREGDASIRGIPSTFNLPSLIPGFREGLLLMSEGSKFRFYVHPDLGYGATGSTRIEPNTLLIFDVELVEIVD
ncbi:MAG: FKBP-type peptidyl-prolyl cis-trans isomerase [Sphaerochaetaceae bacterium]|nr:FKBP-type peptidyl-prolyl cis-trans isomerase [Sphaerochaetaceae bacterium]